MGPLRIPRLGYLAASKLAPSSLAVDKLSPTRHKLGFTTIHFRQNGPGSTFVALTSIFDLGGSAAICAESVTRS